MESGPPRDSLNSETNMGVSDGIQEGNNYTDQMTSLPTPLLSLPRHGNQPEAGRHHIIYTYVMNRGQVCSLGGKNISQMYIQYINNHPLHLWD